LCRAILAFVGDANDGLRLRGVVAPSVRTGIRLGVVGASIGRAVVGEVLRRFDGEDSIETVGYYGLSMLILGYFMMRRLYING